MSQYRTLIDDPRIVALRGLAANAPDGMGAEVGVYQGGSLRAIAESMHPRLVLGFDTFDGLPRQYWQPGEPHEVGDFGNTSLQEVQEYLADCRNVRLVRGLFPESAGGMDFARFAFVHLDVDFYLATKAALDWFWPRMMQGGIVAFDDYRWHRCPGVERVLTEFGQPIHTAANLQAYLVKP